MAEIVFPDPKSHVIDEREFVLVIVGEPSSNLPSGYWGAGIESKLYDFQVDGKSASVAFENQLIDLLLGTVIQMAYAYDDALTSLGPCHWTMGLMPQNGYSNGELPGFLAYVLSKNQASYARWMFSCMPGPVGTSSKLYVLLDIVDVGWDLESVTPKPRKPGTTKAGGGVGGID